MFIFTMSCFFRPYLASNSSGKMASSNVFEHSRPMLNRNGLRDLAGLAVPHHRRRRRLAAHADERQPARALLLGLAQRQRVGAVRVAAAGGGEDLLAGRARAPAWPSTRRRPRRPTDHRGVDVVVLAAARSASPTRTRRPGPSCAPSSSLARVSSSWRQMPAISSGSRTRPNRCMSAAGSHARKRGQARVQVVQPFSPWMQLSRPELLLEVERHVLALLVLVADHVVRARDDATGASGAQPGRDDLGVQLFPLRRPALGLGRRRVGHGHEATRM